MDFLEKLKKGMDIKEEETPLETFKETPVAEPEVVLTSVSKSQEIPGIKKKLSGKIRVKASARSKKTHYPQNENDLFEQEGELTVDVFETEKNIVIQSTIAGINADQLEISIEKDMVSISGKRERQVEEKIENYYCQECYWGRFSREVVLPAEADTSRADAVMKNGILTLTIPKVSKEKVKKLGIKEIE